MTGSYDVTSDPYYRINCSPSPRYSEKEGIMSTVQNNLHFPLTCVDATDQFFSKLKGVVDPESKRKVIGREFINAFDDFAQRLDQELGKRPVFLVQGTLHPGRKQKFSVWRVFLFSLLCFLF